MRTTSLALTIGLATLGLSPPAAVRAQDSADAQLGHVHFDTSCNETAQRRFDRAMRYQHSFWYRASYEIFEDVLKADPECGIAYWGMALSLWDNPHNPPPAPNLPRALDAIQKGKAVGAKTQRERDFIDALAVVYTDYDKVPYRTRLGSYLQAMQALAARYPDDDEAQIAYAITLNVSASPTDKTYAQQIKGAAILEPIWKRQPQHPGIAHYLIHLYDYPGLAEKGLAAARRYASIAPAAPHAQHMPSHIFTRVGAWRDSIASNIASANASKAEKGSTEKFHAWDYMTYAYLQVAQDQKARGVIDEGQVADGAAPSAFAVHYSLAASPARYMVERGDWAGAAQLAPRANNFPQAMALTHFARALGAARAGKPDDATADIAKLADLRDKLTEAKDAYWAGQVDIQWQMASAWLLHAQGNHDEALKQMSAAADAEDKTNLHPVMPGYLVPARELYGDMLLDRGMAKEALAAYAAADAKQPWRYRTLAGAAHAAETLGDKASAKSYYEKLITLTADSNAERPELAAARAFVASN
jgi:tetratricopeptide (TPR) repeat protein